MRAASGGKDVVIIMLALGEVVNLLLQALHAGGVSGWCAQFAANGVGLFAYVRPEPASAMHT